MQRIKTGDLRINGGCLYQHKKKKEIGSYENTAWLCI